jgi:hypothetical protein
VLAGALKDAGRARIVGERTFGKGLIQTIVELSDGSGVAVTVARYQTPAGTDINKVTPLKALVGFCCELIGLCFLVLGFPLGSLPGPEASRTARFPLPAAASLPACRRCAAHCLTMRICDMARASVASAPPGLPCRACPLQAGSEGGVAHAQVGIQPDVVLDADHMPPTDGPGFCKFLAGADAPPLFGPVKSSTLVASS